MKYADFSGRARRAEYWWFVAVEVAILVVLLILAAIIGTIGFILYVLFALAMFIPALALGIRRLHDTGKSGWFVLIGLVPLVGGIILLVFLCTDSQQGSNTYGPSPKYG